MTFEQQLEISYKKLDSPIAEKWYSSALGKVEFGYKIVDMVLKHTEISDKEVLDVGCGDGGISVAFAKKGGNVVGLDLEEDRIELARLRALEHNVKVELIVGNAENTQFKDNSFDIIVCNAVIEHVFNPEKLASEISRVLKPGGILFIDTPSRYSVFQLV